MRRARFIAVMVVGLGLAFTRTAYAQETFPDRLETATPDATASLLSSATSVAIRLAEADQIHLSPIVPQRPKVGGGTLLNSLFATTALMQALDLHSTLKAFGGGATEANPAMSGITKNPAVFAATKAAAAAVTILATRKLARKHKVAAVVTLIAVNSAYAMVVSRNYAMGRR